jgi:SAM-dependent methyltransferase
MKNDQKREWIRPWIWEWGYLTLKPLLDSVKEFSGLAEKENAKNIIDLGCGIKPYKSLFTFAEKFVGFDVEKNDAVDYVGLNWNLPFKNDEFDALISTQVLEHTSKINETVLEINRVVKNNGLIFISAPLIYPEHEPPYDFFRFTRYGLMEIFKDFEVIKISSSGGFLGTQFKLLNVFFNYLPFSKYWAFPIFTINNLAGEGLDCLFLFLKKTGIKSLEKIYEIYMRMPENFMIIMRNKK